MIMAKIRLMARGHGDLELAEWTKGDDISLTQARSTFNEQMTSGRMAFQLFTDRPGVQELIKELTGDEDEVLIVPAVMGG
jgi:hypothetical protein